MKHQIYVNYVASMEAHMGVLAYDDAGNLLEDMEYARSVEPEDTKMLAFVSVFANGSEFPTAAVIDEIIDDGFRQIGVPAERTVYEKQTRTGRFELLWRPGFPNTASSAKAAIHEVVARLKEGGTETVVYTGKPERLFRYGKRYHLTEALKKGRIRIAPATSYNDLTDDPARQDNELCRTFEKGADSLVITTPDGAQLKPKGSVKFVSKRAEDYYVLCVSMEYSSAVAEKFEGVEACLVINDPVKFAERLHTEMEKMLPGYAGFDAPVSYGCKSRLGVCFTKSAGYAVQSEYRFAWIKASGDGAEGVLTPCFVEIGSIDDIAELVDLPS